MSTVLETRGGSSPVLGGGAVGLLDVCLGPWRFVEAEFVCFLSKTKPAYSAKAGKSIDSRTKISSSRTLANLRTETWNLATPWFPKTTKSPTIKLLKPLAVPVGMSKDPCHERSDLLMQDFGIFQPSTYRDLGQKLIFLASRGSSATINARLLVDDTEKWIMFPTTPQKLAIWCFLKSLHRDRAPNSVCSPKVCCHLGIVWSRLLSPEISGKCKNGRKTWKIRSTWQCFFPTKEGNGHTESYH